MSVHEAVVVDDGRTLTSHECSQFEVRAALRRLQRRFDLRPSGRLDDDTKELMSRGRCRNTDSELQRQPKTVLRQTGSRGRRRRSVDGEDLQLEPEIVVGQAKDMERQKRGNSNADGHTSEPETLLSHVGRRGRRKTSKDGGGQQSEFKTTLQQTGSEVQQRVDNTASLQQPKAVLRLTGSGKRRRRSTDVGDATRDPVRVPNTRRAAEIMSPLESRLSTGIDHADLHSRLIPGTDHEPGAALARRTKMFIEIRKRHRLRIAAEALQGVSAQRNHTEEELAAIRRRIRNGRAQRADSVDDEVPTSSRRRRRRRRSISIPSFDDRVNEGPATESANERLRFQKNGNSPVRWRLLADGVSGKIPLIDQRAILELAFRMWSEVIPLKFHESNSIDVVDVDVIIAFAKRQSLIFIVIIAINV